MLDATTGENVASESVTDLAVGIFFVVRMLQSIFGCVDCELD